jgi:hypothetical protein
MPGFVRVASRTIKRKQLWFDDKSSESASAVQAASPFIRLYLEETLGTGSRPLPSGFPNRMQAVTQRVSLTR